MSKMKRQNTHKTTTSMKFKEFHNSDDDIPMQKVAQQHPQRRERTIEAQVQENDTLQAIALRFHCSVAELKRINKIDKENEIFARKVILVPQTIHSVLLPVLDRDQLVADRVAVTETSTKIEPQPSTSTADQSINEIILNTTLKTNRYRDGGGGADDDAVEVTEGTSMMNNAHSTTYMDSHPVVLRQRNDIFNFSGSDCDISWICLLVGILALCVAIPIIYIVYIAEHLDKFHHQDE